MDRHALIEAIERGERPRFVFFWGHTAKGPGLGPWVLSLRTGDAVLVEASPRDRIWGIGMSASHPDATDPRKWLGENLLGFTLMKARAALARR